VACPELLIHGTETNGGSIAIKTFFVCFESHSRFSPTPADSVLSRLQPTHIIFKFIHHIKMVAICKLKKLHIKTTRQDINKIATSTIKQTPKANPYEV